MKQHSLTFHIVPNIAAIEKQLSENLQCCKVDNFTLGANNTLSFTTDVTLRGPELEAVIMGTRAVHSRVNLDY